MNDDKIILSQEESDALQKQQTRFIENSNINVMPKTFSRVTEKQADGNNKSILIFAVVLVLIVIIASLGYLFLSGNNSKSDNQVPDAKGRASALIATSSSPIDVIGSSAPIVATTSVPVIAATSTIATSSLSVATTVPEIIFEADEDTDGDGLNDSLELLIGSDVKNKDTDGDTFSDFSELLALYDPRSKGRLADNINIAKYKNAILGYSVLYPMVWKVNDSGDGSAMFKIPNGQFIQIITEENDKKLSLDAWYKDQVGDEKIKKEQRIVDKNKKWSGIRSIDGLTVYILDAKKKNFYVVAYNIVEKEKPIYQNILDMMVASLEVK